MSIDQENLQSAKELPVRVRIKTSRENHDEAVRTFLDFGCARGECYSWMHIGDGTWFDIIYCSRAKFEKAKARVPYLAEFEELRTVPGQPFTLVEEPARG